MLSHVTMGIGLAVILLIMSVCTYFYWMGTAQWWGQPQLALDFHGERKFGPVYITEDFTGKPLRALVDAAKHAEFQCEQSPDSLRCIGGAREGSIVCSISWDIEAKFDSNEIITEAVYSKSATCL